MIYHSPVHALKITCIYLYPKHEFPNQWQSGNARNLKMGGARFKPQSRLSTQPFRVFRGFLRNSHKYGLGSLKKITKEGTPPTCPGPTAQPNQKLSTTSRRSRLNSLKLLNFVGKMLQKKIYYASIMIALTYRDIIKLRINEHLNKSQKIKWTKKKKCGAAL